MISLPTGWDEDLYIEDRPVATHASRRQTRAPAWDQQAPKGKALKTEELLRRATELCKTKGFDLEQDATMDIETDPVAKLTFEPPREEMQVEPATEQAAVVPMDQEPGLEQPTHCGVFDDVPLPKGDDADVQAWFKKAPRTMSSAFSFRASMNRSLIAMPVTRTEDGGSYRIKLMQLQPRRLVKGCADPSPGVELLEAHVETGFAVSSGTRSLEGPEQLVPCEGKAQELLQQCILRSGAAADEHSKETFELLDTFFGSHAKIDQRAAQSRSGPSRDQEVLRCLSSWLARVNARKVQGESSLLAGARQFGAAPAGDLDLRLKLVFHLLTANAVRAALQELNRAAEQAVEGTRTYFDHLAATIAACGGTSTPCVERRQWLRQQVHTWRAQGVNDLMGASLWRIYCLLAGDLSEVVADALDWRTAFAIYVWYRCPAQGADVPEEMKPSAALQEFQKAVQRYGFNCCFKPSPPYAAGKPAAYTESAPNDIQYNIIRAASDLTDWSDVAAFDYSTHSVLPLDVAKSWHAALLLLSLRGGSTNCENFQKLTQHYCYVLELAGFWQWACYVGQYISDNRARMSVLRGLCLRNMQGARGLDVQRALQESPGTLPSSLWWYCHALRSQASCDWFGAVSGWLQCAEHDRVLHLALGFVHDQVLLDHAAAPFQRGSTEAISLAPLSASGRWLMAVLEEVEESLGQRSDAAADACRDALRFIRDWSQAPVRNYDAVTVARLRWRCEALKEHVLGVPW